MTKNLSIAAFLLGAFAIVWMALGFLNGNILAFIVTLVIAIAYSIGFVELFHFNKATEQLHSSLKQLPDILDNLDNWLEKLPSSLKTPVKLRIEGEKIALPAPVLSSYLVGLLVMLGLLGTFIGMVDTLSGAVNALQGTNELEAIRAGLTAPIKGLSVAFGTSIAGVAGSAMLGLTSTLCRRERVLTARLLDQKINGALRAFSLSHNRQVMTQALQEQAQSFPEVAQLLSQLTDRLDAMGEKLSETLIGNQASFHESTSKHYEHLAHSVENTIKSGLSDSAKLNADNLRPIMQELVRDIAEENKVNQQFISKALEAQLADLNQTHIKASEAVNKTVADNISHYDAQHEILNSKILASAEGLQQGLQAQLSAANDANTQAGMQLNQQFAEAIGHYDTQHESLNNKIMASFDNLSAQNQQLNQEFIQSSSQQYQALLSQHCASDTERQKIWQASFESQSQSLLATTESVNSNVAQQVTQTSAQLHQLLSSTESLLDARAATESQWLDQHQTRMSSIESSLEASLLQLRNDEASRSNAALERLATLESTVTEHLSNLGQSLEAPMSRLIETASEAPKAAAEIIAQLRGEITKNIERDNSLIEERQKTMQQLSDVSASLHKAQESQQSSMTNMLENSASMLSELAEKVNLQFEQELLTLTASAATVADSSVELSSLSEGFTQAVNHFSEANTALVGNLNQLEQKLENNQNQSNEQLNYYVAQAREVIDHSLASQQTIIQQIQQMNSSSNKPSEA